MFIASDQREECWVFTGIVEELGKLVSLEMGSDSGGHRRGEQGPGRLPARRLNRRQRRLPDSQIFRRRHFFSRRHAGRPSERPTWGT